MLDEEVPDEEVPVVEPSLADPGPVCEAEDGALGGEPLEWTAEPPAGEPERCTGMSAVSEATGSARTQGGVGTCTTVGERRAAGGGADAASGGEAKGNTSSWKITCREVKTRREAGSKHR